METDRVDGLVEQTSPFTVDATLDRLSKRIAEAGMTVFAVIDHAENARKAGLAMPASTVLVYGAAAGGTPIMLAAPHSALDLPLRVLVREGEDGRTVVAFRPMAPVLEDFGVPASLASRLGPAQDLLLKVIQD